MGNDCLVFIAAPLDIGAARHLPVGGVRERYISHSFLDTRLAVSYTSTTGMTCQRRHWPTLILHFRKMNSLVTNTTRVLPAYLIRKIGPADSIYKDLLAHYRPIYTKQTVSALFQCSKACATLCFEEWVTTSPRATGRHVYAESLVSQIPTNSYTPYMTVRRAARRDSEETMASLFGAPSCYLPSWPARKSFYERRRS